MAIHKSSCCRWIFAALLGTAFAASLDQVVISASERSRPLRALQSSARRLIKHNDQFIEIPQGGKLSLNGGGESHKTADGKDAGLARFLSFDDYWPSDDWPNATYPGDIDGYLNFNQFNVMFAEVAHEKGYIHSKDLDCANSKPISLYSTPTNYSTPSVIQSNAKNLAEAGYSEYFDVIAWTWKPMGPYPQDQPDPMLSLDLYRIGADKDFTWVGGAASAWDAEWEFFEAETWVPQEFVYGDWGTGVNWMEFTTGFWEDSQDGRKQWDFCLDSVVLLFHKKEE